MWTAFVELIRTAIFGASHAFGGSVGGGILLVSFAVRLGLMPWTLRMARRALEQQRRMAALEPVLAGIRKRWAKDPRRLMEETQRIYAANGIRMLDPRSLLAVAAQWPLFAGLFSAVRRGLGAKIRFLWIADLATPNALLVAVIAGVSALAAALAPAAAPRAGANAGMILIATTVTVIFLATTSSALALSVGTGSAISALQNWMLKREGRRAELAKGRRA
ncbi:MAG TPA: YidC/Oxa1 family membrane protein insertase [Gemmatimonadaceae bacterium]|nr:YidC/Oxa1 family membrane protein insertase [Gemmatimonadaceae bacterium]